MFATIAHGDIGEHSLVPVSPTWCVFLLIRWHICHKIMLCFSSEQIAVSINHNLAFSQFKN